MTHRTTVFRNSVGNTVSIGVLGDVDFSTFRYVGENPLELIRPLLADTDIVVANVETVISNRDLCSNKGGILLKSPSIGADILKDIGIDVALLANNHIDDFGEEGVNDTVENLESRGIEIFGLARKNGITVLRNGLNFRFFGVGTPWQDNSIVPSYGETPGSVANRVGIEGKNVLYFIHGFEELYSTPFPWRVQLLKTIARHFCPLAVVCGHSHVFQGWFREEGIPVCLSYGNGFMNLAYHLDVNPASRIGCYSVIHFDSEGCFRLDEHLYYITSHGIEKLDEDEAETFLKNLDSIQRILNDPEKLHARWEDNCFKAWKPRGIKNLPIIRSLYDWHRKVKKYGVAQRGVVYGRAILAAYLKRQYGLEVFKIREDEKIRVED